MRHPSGFSRGVVRRIVQVAATLVALVASVILGVQPAYASAYWQEISPNSNWHCGPTTQLDNAPSGLVAQTCIVANSSGWAQAVAVISNNSGQAVDFDAFISSNQLYYNNDHYCNDSRLNPGFQRGCFGPSVYVGCSGFYITAYTHWYRLPYASSVTPANYTHNC